MQLQHMPWHVWTSACKHGKTGSSVSIATISHEPESSSRKILLLIFSQDSNFRVLIYWNTGVSPFKLVLPRKRVCSKVFSLFFTQDLKPQVVFAGILTFPVDNMLTTFAIQRITWHTNISLETAHLCILGLSNELHVFLADFACFLDGRFNMLELFKKGQACLRSDTPDTPH